MSQIREVSEAAWPTPLACLVCVFAVKSSYLGTSPIVMDAK